MTKIFMIIMSFQIKYDDELKKSWNITIILKFTDSENKYNSV